MFFIRGDKVALHTLMKNSLLMARCSANHYNEQSGICKTGLPWWNHSWSHCGVNGMCQRQFGISVIVEQIAQYHLVFLNELLTYFPKTFLGRCMLLTHLKWKLCFFHFLFHGLQNSSIIHLLEGTSRWRRLPWENRSSHMKTFPSEKNDCRLAYVKEWYFKKCCFKKNYEWMQNGWVLST